MRVVNGRNRLRRNRKTETFSPMEGIGNMADAMLVFACGLIVALILSWNVDVTDTGEINKPVDAKYEVEGIENGTEQVIEDDQNLEEMGTVYRDPETGKYYVVED
ncbi:MAG: DUF2149 domain-containing protein [Clostridiales bacterium]|nr:DUF2149 domain-containing protein [Clostridiales bacterium]